MSSKRDLEFLYEIGCLRFIPRSWKHFYNADFQNLAEHHVRVVWLALMIAAREGKGNHEKIMKMALIHDVAESRTNDLDYVSRQYATRDEDKALKDIIAETSIENDFTTIWKEYEKRNSIESKIVKDADTLDVDLELQEQEAQGNKLKHLWDRKVVRDTLYTKAAKEMWDEIQVSNPHDWHLYARNRFNIGDWKKKKK